MFTQHFFKVFFVFFGLGLASCQQCAALTAPKAPKAVATFATTAQEPASKPSFYERTEESLFNSNAFKKLSFNTQIFFRTWLKKMLITGATLTAAVAIIAGIFFGVRIWKKSHAAASAPVKPLEAQLDDAKKVVFLNDQEAFDATTKADAATDPEEKKTSKKNCR